MSAFHQEAGSCSLRGGLVGGCGERASPTTLPSASCRKTTVLDCVEESIPATSVRAIVMPPPG